MGFAPGPHWGLTATPDPQLGGYPPPPEIAGSATDRGPDRIFCPWAPTTLNPALSMPICLSYHHSVYSFSSQYNKTCVFSRNYSTITVDDLVGTLCPNH